QQHVGVLADRLLVRVPEQAFRALVPTGDDAVEALTEDGLFGAFHDRRQMREPALGALALGEIADEGVEGRRRTAFDARQAQLGGKANAAGTPAAQLGAPAGNLAAAGDDIAVKALRIARAV